MTSARLLRYRLKYTIDRAPVQNMQSDLFDTGYNAVLAADDYATFKRRLRAYDCQRCLLGQSRSDIVIDWGSPTASIMLIGEWPGDNEDFRGEPFVGRAGKLLDKMLRAIDIDPARDVIIANVTKCKPEFDRAPLKDEVDACMPFLGKQIALATPRSCCATRARSRTHGSTLRRSGTSCVRRRLTTSRL